MAGRASARPASSEAAGAPAAPSSLRLAQLCSCLIPREGLRHRIWLLGLPVPRADPRPQLRGLGRLHLPSRGTCRLTPPLTLGPTPGICTLTRPAGTDFGCKYLKSYGSRAPPGVCRVSPRSRLPFWHLTVAVLEQTSSGVNSDQSSQG